MTDKTSKIAVASVATTEKAKGIPNSSRLRETAAPPFNSRMDSCRWVRCGGAGFLKVESLLWRCLVSPGGIFVAVEALSQGGIFVALQGFWKAVRKFLFVGRLSGVGGSANRDRPLAEDVFLKIRAKCILSPARERYFQKSSSGNGPKDSKSNPRDPQNLSR